MNANVRICCSVESATRLVEPQAQRYTALNIARALNSVIRPKIVCCIV